MKTIKTLTATITIGKKIGYSANEYSKGDLYDALQKIQDKLILKQGIYLSAYVSNGDIVLSGQIEPHFKIEFINYPKFPLPADIFKDEIINITQFLMITLQQNRVVTVFDDETIMFEIDDKIDPNIIEN